MAGGPPIDIPYVICISGPTAAGKTNLAMELADKMPCQLISVDSALIYRCMDIGTAKPTAEERARYPHALIDILDPAEIYSAADFRRDALAQIESAIQAKRTPLLVGGTMLYYRALLGGLSNLPQANPAVRQELQKQAETTGWHKLHDRLGQVDPVSARRIHPNDPQRLVRALEVFELTGKSLTELTRHQEPGLAYPSYQFSVAPGDRNVLHARIAKRFEGMLNEGFEDEVRGLKERGELHLDLPSMRAVGYRQMWQYLDGDLSFKEMQERAIIATRQLAKRQITWLRSWPDLHWLDPSANNLASSALAIMNKEQPTRPQMWLPEP